MTTDEESKNRFHVTMLMWNQCWDIIDTHLSTMILNIKDIDYEIMIIWLKESQWQRQNLRLWTVARDQLYMELSRRHENVTEIMWGISI